MLFFIDAATSKKLVRLVTIYQKKVPGARVRIFLHAGRAHRLLE
jgi:hypothetical protein